MLWTWLALIATPLLSLANLSISHALTTPSCAQQTELWLHALNAGDLVLSLALLALAWREHGLPAGERDDGAEAATRRRFLGSLAVPAAALFTLVTLAQWLSVWVLSPCAS